jgi:hypothetical protein
MGKRGMAKPTSHLGELFRSRSSLLIEWQSACLYLRKKHKLDELSLDVTMLIVFIQMLVLVWLISFAFECEIAFVSSAIFML